MACPAPQIKNTLTAARITSKLKFRFTKKEKYEALYNKYFEFCYLRIYDSINPYPFREHLNNNTDKVNLTFDDYAKYYNKQNEKVITCINMIKSKMKKIFI